MLGVHGSGSVRHGGGQPHVPHPTPDPQPPAPCPACPALRWPPTPHRPDQQQSAARWHPTAASGALPRPAHTCTHPHACPCSRGRYILVSDLQESATSEDVLLFFQGFDLHAKSVTFIRDRKVGGCAPGPGWGLGGAGLGLQDGSLAGWQHGRVASGRPAGCLAGCLAGRGMQGA